MSKIEIIKTDINIVNKDNEANTRIFYRIASLIDLPSVLKYKKRKLIIMILNSLIIFSNEKTVTEFSSKMLDSFKLEVFSN